MPIRSTPGRTLAARSSALHLLPSMAVLGCTALIACGGNGSTSTGTTGSTTTSTTATTSTTSTTMSTTGAGGSTTGTGGDGGMATTTGTGGMTTTGTGGMATTAGTGGAGGVMGTGGMGGSMLCQPGSTKPCYNGPNGTENTGLCHGGEQTCNAAGQAYGVCMGEVLPVPETCNTPGDDDCNGVVNDQGVGCACVPNSTSPCYDGPAGTQNKGICVGGMHTCDAQGQGFGACMGQVLPMVENCLTPAVDEDCDGLTPACPG
ncbi:MAG: hypothetical protein ABI193_20395 [Minicystis sp.]